MSLILNHYAIFSLISITILILLLIKLKDLIEIEVEKQVDRFSDEAKIPKKLRSLLKINIKFY